MTRFSLDDDPTTASLQHHLQRTLPRASLKPDYAPGCPAVALYLIDPESLIGPLSNDEMTAVWQDTPYWTFCWASGQVLAASLLAHPEQVKGRRVLDFGTGSGIVAIAAALAGASEVIACDIDPVSLDATRANAALNNVSLRYCDNWSDWQEPIDLITAADVLYDSENHDFLEAFRHQSQRVLVADSRVKQLPNPHYRLISQATASSWPDLEEPDEFNCVRLYEAYNRGTA